MKNKRKMAAVDPSVYDVEILIEYPPNIGEIRQTGMELSGKEIFAWGDKIYNPGNGYITKALIMHEKVHFKQQDGDPSAWWARYLEDVEFRLDQELDAHRTEYKEFCRWERNREKRARYLSEISFRLAGPLYGRGISYQDAMKRIR